MKFLASRQHHVRVRPTAMAAALLCAVAGTGALPMTAAANAHDACTLSDPAADITAAALGAKA